MLHADLHHHSKEDPCHGHHGKLAQYSARQLVDRAKQLKLDVISLTLHGKVHFPLDLVQYAKAKGITMIPGVELWPAGPHVLVYGITDEERKKIKTLDDLEEIKNNAVICAAHPFYPFGTSIGAGINDYEKMFHAVEYNHFRTWFYNIPNEKAKRWALLHKKTLIGNSDTHDLAEMGYTWTELEAQPTKEGILEALRKPKRAKVVSKPMPAFFVAKLVLKHVTHPHCRGSGWPRNL
ncbi:MAG: PHP-associated domain-containing protein [Candidatus Woesearchaeota archaeon]